ncbi:MAG TPA: hypothetical protein PLE70_05385 [Methanolinea sp.]|nr:hypothetical protein [Methanolinea sp.]
MKPPFSFEGFLGMCREFIPAHDYIVLCNLPEPARYQEDRSRQETVRRWIEFDTTLRNELVKVRSQRVHREPSSSLRPGASPDPTLTAAATAALANPSLLAAEMSLDEVRWKALDELAAGHHFDLVLLITYALKLLILIRWEPIHNADPGSILEHTLQKARG